MGNIEKHLTTEEIAEALRVHKVTIVRWIREGKLKAKKVGRRWLVNVNDYNEFVDRNSLEDTCA
jgi:excisionase family DNA binding protein